MLPVKRPDPHPSHDAVARSLLDAVRAEVARGEKPVFERREMWQLSYEPGAKGWDARWGAREAGLYKRALVGTTGLLVEAKCVWCEQLRSWQSPELLVDHLRPKGRVTTWDGSPAERCQERPIEVHAHDGYWWLAYTWGNWNLACWDCNSLWKRCLLPRVGPSLPHEEGVEASEVLLLLDPASEFRTREHFGWDRWGVMSGRSEVGRATIITCGLNRGLLVEARRKRISDVQPVIEDYADALASGHDGAFERAAIKLATIGDNGAEFAGMVRHFAEERIGEPWESLPLR